MTTEQNPLVSIIIPCYNHGRYLTEAVESIRKQSYKNVEIIVVDDGSSDDTKQVSESLKDVKYIYQQNQGLSAARNTGFAHSSGTYLVFLDADDYFFSDGLEKNVRILQANPSLAFVSGAHDKVDENHHVIYEDPQEVIHSDHYLHLLQGNYIGMHATVMYTRWILDKFKFDTNLRSCEDYDLYFRIARDYPVANHDTKVAAYRIHGSNMSANIPFMLKMVLQVQGSQKPLLRDDHEREALKNGIRIWTDYYTDKMLDFLKVKILNGQVPETKYVQFLFAHSPKHVLKLNKTMLKQKLKSTAKKIIPSSLLSLLHRKGIIKYYQPPVNSVNWGDLERAQPFSNSFGYDRGGPVDRYYIEKFLQVNNATIQGRVFEIGDNAYTLQFGGSKVKQSDVLHVYQANDTVTFIGDLTDAPQIPSNAFDCIILTQTLHLIYDFKAALNTCYRMLKPGGSLLLTVPGITHIDKDEWKEYWLWAFTNKSIERIFNETFPGAKVDIQTYGNVYIASAFLYGMGLPEIKKELLDQHDPSYQVIISVKATK